MAFAGTPSPAGHTAAGGVLVGSPDARRRLVLFEDPQCPYCREFEEASGDLLRREVAAGAVAVEYRMRSFLGPESERAAGALAAAAEAGRFDELRRELFANQPPEHSGGFSAQALLELGRSAGIAGIAGIAGPDYEAAVREERYVPWARRTEQLFSAQNPTGTPAGVLDGRALPPGALQDPDALGRLIRG
jgi:hypothetical protein